MARRLTIRLRPAAEDGFGIIEVLVSAVLVVLVSTGVFVAFDAATNASGTNKARSVAANLARTDQERLRGLTAQALTTLPPTSTQSVDGRTFTIASTTEWVADRTGTPTCTSADGRADYLKMRSSVTWPGMGGLKAVASESLRAIPRGAFRPNQGSISVKVTDRSGVTPVAGATVSITGLPSATTNALGCVLIDQVPVGAYTATITKPGLVADKYPNAPAFTQAFNVAKEQTSTIEAGLDTAGTARVSFRTTTVAGCGAPPTPTACVDASTTGDGFTIANTGLINPTQRNFTLAMPTAPNANLYSGTGSSALTTSATRGVFPFVSAFKVWAGACDEANPQKYAQLEVSQIVPRGALTATGTSTYYVRKPRMQINVRRYTTSGQVSGSTAIVTSRRVTVTPVVSACARIPAPVNTNGSGIAAFIVPYGQYSICAEDSTSASSARRRRGVLRVNGAANGTVYNALYNGGATEPANGAIILPFATSASTPC